MHKILQTFYKEKSPLSTFISSWLRINVNWKDSLLRINTNQYQKDYSWYVCHITSNYIAYIYSEILIYPKNIEIKRWKLEGTKCSKCNNIPKLSILFYAHAGIQWIMPFHESFNIFLLCSLQQVSLCCGITDVLLLIWNTGTQGSTQLCPDMNNEQTRDYQVIPFLRPLSWSFKNLKKNRASVQWSEPHLALLGNCLN